MIFPIVDNRRVNIEVGDFVDIQTNIPSDALWGRSFEVMELYEDYPEQILIRINLTLEETLDVMVDTKLIVNNFTIVPDEVE